MKTVDLLAQMQAAQTKNHEDLVKVVNDGFARIATAMSDHSESDIKQFGGIDKRLAPVESMRRTLRWGAGAIFVQFLVFMFALAAYAMHAK